MKLFSQAAGVIAAALLVAGGIAPVAQGQASQVVTPEDQDAYVQQFHHEGNTPPVVDGVGGYTEQEIAEIHEAIRQAQESGAPNEELIPGEMWSDKVELPVTIDKAAADEAEIAIAQQQSQPQTRGLAAAAACQTFWPSPHQVCGAILERYIQQGAQFGWMLFPSEGQTLNPDGQGYRQRFMNGFVYWHPTTGAHAVNNYSAQVWERNGWESGWMGYPTGGEVPVNGSNPIDGELSGWVQTFQGGRVYRSPVLDGFQVASINGLILDKWLELGGPDSDLGFPIADEAVTADGVGRFSVFQNGVVYWHPQHGAHPILGDIYSIWREEGAESGEFGYPIGDPEKYTENMANQVFEKGELAANLYPNPLEAFIEFLPFANLEEAIEYFENGLSNSRVEANSLNAKKDSIQCQSQSANIHVRTKSDGVGIRVPKIGFKARMDCDLPGTVSDVVGYGWIYYDYWGRWAQAAYAQQFFGNRNSVVQTNLEAGCSGEKNTLFWGTSYFQVTYEGQPYFGQSATNYAYLPCTIDRS